MFINCNLVDFVSQFYSEINHLKVKKFRKGQGGNLDFLNKFDGDDDVNQGNSFLMQNLLQSFFKSIPLYCAFGCEIINIYFQMGQPLNEKRVQTHLMIIKGN